VDRDPGAIFDAACHAADGEAEELSVSGAFI